MFPNVYVDLSYTFIKYGGSSVELDIKYLLNHFDNRLLFGSDFPEVSLNQAYGGLDLILPEVKQGVGDRICYENLRAILSAKEMFPCEKQTNLST
jgi:predicted TIM-barrel fold metal-dependent hydrolase